MSKNRTSHSSLLILFVALTLLLAACGGGNKPAAAPSPQPSASPAPTAEGTPAATIEPSEPPAPALETTSLSIGSARDTQLSPLIVIALEEGYFKEEGLEVKLELFPAGPDVTAALGSKSIQLGSSGDIPPIIAKASGLPITIIAQQADISGVQTLVVNPDKIKTPSDLNGKKVAYVPGTVSEAFFLRIVEKYGLDAKSIEPFKIGPTELVPAFQAGNIDAFAIWQPVALNGVKNGGVALLTGRESHVPGEEGPQQLINSYSILVGHNDFVDKHPETVKAVLRALNKSVAFIKSNPDGASAHIGKTLGQEAADIKTLIALNQYALDLTPELVGALESISKFLLDNEKIKEVPDFKTFINSTYLKAVASELVTIP
ncbi:ABC transporter substrate-binding protein [Paenibacillus paeoniae]|uniref:Aliphatic sulfonate ABC transporter substrate-binding protein n=1 Tax=Paenibacillus paeoniae TaxID=2292705 RepID=A0A371PGK0_9BACL|nr:ABC transporter substrate-binding protein [Paenibacillus paeoniae]REK75071.1 aliphatic sulfonate ABC transporter substrate-binding protein [Paenibacillus paeoniae]